MPFSSHHRFTDNPLCRQSATRWLHSYKRCRCPNVWIVIPCSICQPPCFLSLCPPVTNSPPDSPGVSGSYNLILSWVVGVFHTPLGLTLTLFPNPGGAYACSRLLAQHKSGKSQDGKNELSPLTGQSSPGDRKRKIRCCRLQARLHQPPSTAWRFPD